MNIGRCFEIIFGEDAIFNLDNTPINLIEIEKTLQVILYKKKPSITALVLLTFIILGLAYNSSFGDETVCPKLNLTESQAKEKEITLKFLLTPELKEHDPEKYALSDSELQKLRTECLFWFDENREKLEDFKVQEAKTKGIQASSICHDVGYERREGGLDNVAQQQATFFADQVENPYGKITEPDLYDVFRNAFITGCVDNYNKGYNKGKIDYPEGSLEEAYSKGYFDGIFNQKCFRAGELDSMSEFAKIQKDLEEQNPYQMTDNLQIELFSEYALGYNLGCKEQFDAGKQNIIQDERISLSTENFDSILDSLPTIFPFSECPRFEDWNKIRTEYYEVTIAWEEHHGKSSKANQMVTQLNQDLYAIEKCLDQYGQEGYSSVDSPQTACNTASHAGRFSDACYSAGYYDSPNEFEISKQVLSSGDFNPFDKNTQIEHHQRYSECFDQSCRETWWKGWADGEQYRAGLKDSQQHMQKPIQEEGITEDVKLPEEVAEKITDSGGGCLIATATYGSELSPQVQQLRELRDNKLLQTKSGSAFMSGFNYLYYSFSPQIADYERENPHFKEAVKFVITPMISSLSILSHADIDTEAKVLGYGISLILLNIGMYVGVPIAIFVGIKKRF